MSTASGQGEAGEVREHLRFLQVHFFYGAYQDHFYEAHPGLESDTFGRQIGALVRDGFAGIHLVAPYLDSLGYDTELVIANNMRAQMQWLHENRESAGEVDLESSKDLVRDVVRAQIDAFDPDVLYLTEPLVLESDFVRSLARRPRLVLGWRAANIPGDTDWSEFDVILSSLSGVREAAMRLGARSAEPFLPGFPRWIQRGLGEVTPEYDVTFCGQWTLEQHPQRNRFLREIARLSRPPAPRLSCGYYLSGQTAQLPPDVGRVNLGPRWGMDMYRAIRSGRISLDARGEIGLLPRRDRPGDPAVDLARNETANMRIFEVTGCGGFLLTEHRDNLGELFEVGAEIETFSGSSELQRKVLYYLEHPEEREEIARRGMERCHREHSMQQRARQLDELVRTHLARGPATESAPAEIRTLPAPVSGGMTEAAFSELVPRTFTIETALACNLRCPECAIGADIIERRKSLMSFDQFKAIADKIRPYAEYVYLHLWGEPLLNRAIFDMIEYTSRFARTNVSTNGLLLDRERCERLIDSGLTDLIVSIDGFSQEVYEQYRVGGEVSEALANLALLQEINKSRGEPVRLSPQFIVFEHNEHEKDAFEDFCRSLGLVPSFKAPYVRMGDGKFAPPSDPKFRRPEFDTVDDLRRAMTDCENPREVFTIHADGSVVVCCHDWNRDTCFGNVLEQDVLEIWNSPDFRRYRWDVLSGRAPEFCVEKCMTWSLSEDARAARSGELPVIQAPRAPAPRPSKRVNLCGGSVRLDGWVHVDLASDADVSVDLERDLLPFDDGSVDELVCISAINYFTLERAVEIVADVHRVLRPGGIARFGVQDLELLASRYLARDRDFWFERTADGGDRFPGDTFAEKLNQFFGGFPGTDGRRCKFVYDYETLARLFERAGFGKVERRGYRQSAIADVEKIDNRPDQMFFLEAQRADARAGAVVRDEPSEEAAWQRDLAAYRQQPENVERALVLARTMLERSHFDEARRLFEALARARPGDADVRTLFEQAEACVRESALDPAERARRCERLATLPGPHGSGSDLDHLRACVDWLLHAQSVRPGGGVASQYDLVEQRWLPDYPETTGYIVPTLLAARRVQPEGALLDAATRMADWLVDIQDPEGGTGEPVGVYARHPRIFNTSQVMLGWLSLYDETGRQHYLEASDRAARWIVDSQDPDGKWTANTYRGPRSYHVRTAWALLEHYERVEDPRYLRAAERAVDWVLRRSRPGGWFEQTSLDDPERPWTHLVGYTLVGLIKICLRHPEVLDAEAALGLLDRAAIGLRYAYLERCRRAEARAPGAYVGLSGTLDRDWQGPEDWSCLVGDAQLGFFLGLMGAHGGNGGALQAARRMREDLKRVHLIHSSEPDLRGGLCGAHPIDGRYAAWALPNWGPKFLADFLLQELLPPDSWRFLG